ncbi:cysteine desulfurase [Streptomyces thinghirensis]|nr:cysteine desulfurase [Streptomyces thinghirensis]
MTGFVPYLDDGDEILVPFADHRANLDPWVEAQRLLAARGIRVHLRAPAVPGGLGRLRPPCPRRPRRSADPLRGRHARPSRLRR